MAWRRVGDKPIIEPILTQFTDAYMQHQGEMSNIPGFLTSIGPADDKKCMHKKCTVKPVYNDHL